MSNLIKCVVAGTNPNGESDLYFVIVSTLDPDSEDHIAAAIKAAEGYGYSGPFVAFDENDNAGKAMLPLFMWKLATTVTAYSS